MSEEPMEVDMMAAARDAQWSPEGFLGPGAVRAVAPAKANLFLGVGSRCEDGYHDVATVMHALALHDTLFLHRREASADEVAQAAAEGLPHAVAVAGPAANLMVSVDVADKAATPYRQSMRLSVADNLVFKALDALARAIGHDGCEAVSVRIEKAIPFEAGLAGGSSDAAAALVAAAQWWGIALDDPVLAQVASGLGADVAFFLGGGCALLEGNGSRFVHRLEPMKGPVVLVKPSAGVATAEAYRAFDWAPEPVPEPLLARARSARCAEDAPCFNNLTAAAESLAPVLTEVRAWLASAPGVLSPEGVLLCGSGATTLAPVSSFARASELAAEARSRGWWGRATTFSGLRAAVVR